LVDAARQTVLLEAKASVGHVALEPVQVSATSHTPATAARQVVPLATKRQVDEQHDPAAPFWAPRSHCSALPSVPLTVSVVLSPHVEL
jgi:hypothetical protein